MLPNDTNLIKEIIYTVIGFLGAFMSIIYGLLGGKRISLLSSLGMIAIGGFIGWIGGAMTGSNLVAGIAGAMSIEIMHSVKELGPEIIKQKIKNVFGIK